MMEGDISLSAVIFVLIVCAGIVALFRAIGKYHG